LAFRSTKVDVREREDVRIWFQLMASETRSGFVPAVQRYLDTVVSTDTEINVRGTTHGAYADQYRLLFHYDEREIIRAGLQAQREGYDVFALGNSLDPAVVALREVLDIPVVIQMETSCSVACMTGEQFGVIATNEKSIPRYREIVRNYGMTNRLAGVDSVRFDHLPRIHEAFEDQEVFDAVVEAFKDSTRRLAAAGADTVFATGVHTTVAALAGLREVDGVVVQDTYALLARFAEAAGAIHKLTGQWTSRGGLYAKPSPEVLAKAAEMHDIPELLDPVFRQR
jgi:allantoin racemase